MERVRSWFASSRRAVDAVLVLAFLGAIYAPFADELIRPASARSPATREFRTPAPKPELPHDTVSLTEFPQKYENYFNDSYGLRDKLLRWHSLEKVFVFGVSPTNDIFVGRDRWLFYASDWSLLNFRGLHRFRRKELEEWRDGLELAAQRCKEIGAQFLYVIVPDKESIYPEHVPARYNRLGERRADQLLKYLADQGSTVDILDLRPVFLAEKVNDTPNEFLYSQLGTHWNGRGAFLAARTILEHVQKRLPATRVPDFADYIRRPVGDAGDSWGPRMYIEDVLRQETCVYELRGGWHAWIQSETAYGPLRTRITQQDDKSLPRAVILHDSFGPFIEWHMAEQFSYLACIWENRRPLRDLRQHRPDIVIVMLVERSLNGLPASEIVPTLDDPWRAAFDGSKETIWAPALAPTAGFATQEAAELEWLDGGDGPALELRTHAPIDKLVTPSYTPPEQGFGVMRLSIESPVQAGVNLYFRAPGDPIYRRRSVYSAILESGPNEIFLPLDKPMDTAALLLAPSVPGNYRVRGLEVRRVDR
jgi:hypothetical protein